MAARLSEDQLETYTNTGVLAPIRALPGEAAEEIGATIQKIADELLEDGAGIEALSFRPWEGDLHPFEGPIGTLATHENVLQVVGEILGNQVMIRGCDIYSKATQDPESSPVGELAVPWHWDDPYVEDGSEHALTVWFALSETGPQNGGLRYVVGSHLTPLERKEVHHRFCTIQGDEWSQFRNLALHDVQMSPGEFSVHHPCVVHSSEVNLGVPRLGVAIRYFSPKAPKDVIGGDSGHPVIGSCDDGAYEPTPNFPIRWWDVNQRPHRRSVKHSSAISLLEAPNEEDERILASEAMGVVDAIERVLTAGVGALPPAPRLEGATSPPAPKNDEDDTTPQHGTVFPFTRSGIHASIEGTGMRVLDADGTSANSWKAQMSAWTALHSALLPVGSGEEGPIYEVSSYLPPLVFRPRRLSRRESQVRFNGVPIHATSMDLGLWIAHHAETLQCQESGAILLLPAFASFDEARLWHKALSVGFEANDMPSGWSIILNLSSRFSISNGTRLADLFLGHLAGLSFSKAEFAGSLFSERPNRRSLLAPCWEEESALAPLMDEALASVLALGEQSGFRPYFASESSGGRLGDLEGNPGVPDAPLEGKTAPVPSSGVSLSEALLEAFKGVSSVRDGDGWDLHRLEAYRAQHANWVRAGVQVDGLGRLEAKSFSQFLRKLGSEHGIQPAVLGAWRQWVLGEEYGKEHTAYTGHDTLKDL